MQTAWTGCQMYENILYWGLVKKTEPKLTKYPPAVRRKLRKAIYDFDLRAFGEEMTSVNIMPLAARRRYIGEMVDHAIILRHPVCSAG
jgi:hypothetical protein